jgi:rhodanese-related sulfurtransferase
MAGRNVRSPEEFAASHIDGAVNIPLDALSTESARMRTAPAVVTVCSGGRGRSDRAAQLLREHGLVSVWSLCGGVREWQEQLMRAEGARS